MVRTNAEHQQTFRARQTAKGLVQFVVWLPEAVVADFKQAARLARENPSLTVGRMKDRHSGRLKDQI